MKIDKRLGVINVNKIITGSKVKRDNIELLWIPSKIIIMKLNMNLI